LCSKIAAMKKDATKIDLYSLKAQFNKEAIGDDFVIVDDISDVQHFDYPTKIDFAVMNVCLKGRVEGRINLKPYIFSENNLFMVLPGQIIQYSYRSDDYSGLHIAMSKRFTENLELNIKDSISALLHLKDNPIIHLLPDEVTYLLDYFNILRQTVRRTHNPNRVEVVRLLIMALFYNFQQMQGKVIVTKSKRDDLFEAFYRLLLAHYKESREVGFYADKLCLTPKYLSAVIKDLTGKSAFEWINDYVMLEAKALLKSTNMTIQQISDELHFANQSFFGKFFKRNTGMSPRKYKEKG